MDTHSFTYVVHDENTRDAIVIDPVLGGAQKEFLVATELNLKGILETHAHADHLTGSQELKSLYPSARICIGNRITEVRKNFGVTGESFDLLFSDFEEMSFGSIKVKAIPTPGHTPSCMNYLIGENLFTGDSLFMPDFGTGRCDFPGGSAEALFHSITQNLYTLPESTKVFVGHDYCPDRRELAFQTTIGESKKSNKHVKSSTLENEFVKFRNERDKTLQVPKDLEKNIRFNINGGKI